MLAAPSVELPVLDDLCVLLLLVVVAVFPGLLYPCELCVELVVDGDVCVVVGCVEGVVLAGLLELDEFGELCEVPLLPGLDEWLPELGELVLLGLL